MLQRAPSHHVLRALRAELQLRPYTCSTCVSRRNWISTTRPRRNARNASLTPTHHRSFSQPAPTTSVGAKAPIPTRFQSLHDELSDLARVGANYVNLSQLQLAIRGLEAEDATIRIAVLGVNGLKGARRLIRVLLADPLSAQAEWEKVLLAEEDDGKAILLRYGEDLVVEDRHPLVKTISIPVTGLLQHKLEVLVTETNAGYGKSFEVDGSLENLLVPMLGAPNSASGRTSLLAYPVHNTIVFGEGMEGASGVFRLTQYGHDALRQSTTGVVNVNWRTNSKDVTSGQHVLAVNVEEAEEALAKFRKTVENATEYERGWLDSNVALVQPFLLSENASNIHPLKPALRTLIQNALDEIEALLAPAKSTIDNGAQNTTKAVQSLDKVITSWSESAHTELRNSLENAFHSRSWRKLSWWKLPWRVDDISLVLGELVQRAYLPQSEKGMIWTSGCITQAGLLKFEPTIPDSSSVTSLGTAPTGKQLHDMNSLEPTISIQPWPVQVSASRKTLLASIPDLQATAQSLLMRSLSTTALSTTVAALAYVSVTSTSIFEAGAVASLGLVLSARSLQKNWEKAKSDWVLTVEEEGRRVLVETEAWARGVVSEGSRSIEQREDEEGERAVVRKVKQSVERCRELVAELDDSGR